MKSLNKLAVYTMIFTAISTTSLAECDAKLAACDKLQNLQQLEINQLKLVIEKKNEMIHLVSKQRDALYDDAAKNGSNIPWYLWVVVGVAGGVVLTRGLR